MKAAWKQKLEGELGAVLKVELPQGATVIRAGISPDDRSPAFWFLCDPTASKENRFFTVVCTGTEVPDEAQHCGMWWEGALVFHLFELDKSSDPSLLVNVFGKEADDGEA
jgi:hypothetical protein